MIKEPLRPGYLYAKTYEHEQDFVAIVVSSDSVIASTSGGQLRKDLDNFRGWIYGGGEGTYYFIPEVLI